VQRECSLFAGEDPVEPAVAVVMTCFNRRALTLAALAAAHVSAQRASLHLVPVVVDDASTDGTASAVRMGWPMATVIETAGNLFWCRGMHLGMQVAMGLPVTHVLWLNDDTVMTPDALSRMWCECLELTQRHGQDVIMIGATHDGGQELTYGGQILAGSPLRGGSYHPIGGANKPLRCDAMHGNCVLIPISVVRRIGNIDPVFEHAMGDTDYSLRARAAGVPLYVSSGFVGTCKVNPVAGGFTDKTLSLSQRWRAILHRKGLPWRSWLHFSRRHGGLLWPVFFAWPYVRVVLSSAGLVR
jgi:GT2 family glycosyltransferase